MVDGRLKKWEAKEMRDEKSGRLKGTRRVIGKIVCRVIEYRLYSMA